MNKTHKENTELSIIIPIKDEQDNIIPLIQEIRKEIKSLNYEIIIISDSQDKSHQRIQAQKDKKVQLFCPGYNDLAQSVAYGINHASGKIVCVMDGDGSHSPQHIMPMYKKINHYDIIIATRKELRQKKWKWGWGRYIMSYCARILAYPILPIKDNMSGFFVVKRKNLPSPYICKIRGYKILLDIITIPKIKKIGTRAYYFSKRASGKSKINSKTILQFIISLPYLYVKKLNFLR